MTKSFSLFIVACCFTTPFFASAMESHDFPELKKINAVAFISKTSIALASPKGLHLLTNPKTSHARLEKLFTSPANNLIVNNKNKQQIGVICDNFFYAHDISTRKPLFSYRIPNKEHHSATFGPDGTVFLCHNGRLISYKEYPIVLPLVDLRNPFNVVCHPEREEFLYASGETLSIKSLSSNGMIRYPRILDDEIVHSALYSPHSPHIVLFTQQKVFILNHETRKIFKTKLEACNDALFLPDNSVFALQPSSILAALCNSMTTLHFYDFLQQKTICTATFYNDKREETKNFSKNIFDFSPNYAQFVVAIGHQCFVEKTPDKIMNIIQQKPKAIFAYWLLKHYSNAHNNFIPQEIIQSLMCYVINLHS